MGQQWGPVCEGGALSLQSFLVTKYSLYIGHATGVPPSPTAPPSCRAWGSQGAVTQAGQQVGRHHQSPQYYSDLLNQWFLNITVA